MFGYFFSKYSLFIFVLFLNFFQTTSILRADNHPEFSKTLRIALTLPNYVERFDPNKSFLSTYDIILNPLFDKLMTFDRQGERALLAAKSIDFSPDAMSIRIVLRDDIFWSYGERVVAGDFVRGLLRSAMADSRTAHLMDGIVGSDKWAVGDYSTPIGIEALDDSTIVLRLSKAYGYDLANLMNMHAHPYPPEGRNPGPHIASNGPYMIEEMEKEMVALVRNPHYRGERPPFDRLEFVGFSHDVAVDYFISGKADILLGPLGKQKKWLLEHHKDGAIETGLPRKYTIVMATPTQNTPAVLQDAEFRRALYNALDRRSFEKSDSFFKSQWHCGFIPAPMPCNPERTAIWHSDESMDDRVRQAKAIVERAGYSRENPLKLSLVVASSIRGYTEIGGFVKSSWHEIGVDVELVDIPNYAEAFQVMKSGKYDLLISSFYQLSPHQYISRLELFGDWTIGKGSRNSYMDDLVLRMSRSSGSEYARLIVEAERYMKETMKIIPIVSDSQLGFYANWLSPNQENVTKLNLRYFTHK